MRPRISTTALIALASASILTAPRGAHAGEDAGKPFELEGYATLNYYHFDWQTDPQRRDAVDLERMAIEGEYKLSPRIRVETEIEFEHGGTGTTMELDRFEESGEYEAEIEKGGEVRVEKLAASFLIHPAFNVRLGHFFLPIGLSSTLDEPVDYFTVERSEAERAILPVLWDETGVEAFGDLPGVRYQLQVVNGLDASGFSSGNWVALGHQGRFETVNAENWALAGRLDSRGIPSTRLGISGYFGNSRDNRPKPDLHAPAYVGIVSADARWARGPFVARAVGIWGGLSNSEAVSRANANLSNNLNVKGTPVGSQAYAASAEAGVDVLRLAGARQSGYVFGRFDAYDTMWKTEGQVLDNPAWQRTAWTGGINYFPHPHVVLKLQQSFRANGHDQSENTLSAGLGLVVE